ncbi:MAG: hypothetical protein IKF45_01905, partial [Lachnospiraceae bacterium]|nr:hypothetical protein [Lachnospiraceae bacterium]
WSRWSLPGKDTSWLANYSDEAGIPRLCRRWEVQIRHSSWYMKNRPDYSREEFDKDIEDASALGELKHCFRNREMPQQAAREWELSIF